MDSGVAPAAYANAVLANGQVVYGGAVTLAGSTEVEHIAIWDGESWGPLGEGVNNFVRTILATTGSEFVAGGHFTQAGGQPAGLIARWDGTGWVALGQGLDAGSCRALAMTQDGDLIAGGSFLQADNLPAWGVARWDGVAWHKIGANSLGGGVTERFGTASTSITMVNAIVEMPNQDLVIGGNFRFADGVSASGVARWDGQRWFPLGAGTNHLVRDMIVLPNGDLIVTGIFSQAGGVAANGLARWDGTQWHAVGQGLSGLNGASPFALALSPSGQVVIGGKFDAADGVPVNNVAHWDPVSDTWSAMGSGMLAAIQTTVFDLDIDQSGIVFAAGQFASAGGNTSALNAARYECLQICRPDWNHDNMLNFFDVQAFLAAFAAEDPASDLNADGAFNFFDLQQFLAEFSDGCP
jgi:hypothetical protein